MRHFTPLACTKGFVAIAAALHPCSVHGAAQDAMTSATASTLLSLQDVQDQRDEHDLRVTLDLRYMYGETDGFVQTPRGGEEGTTSNNRPSLSEMGIDDVHAFDASLEFQLDQHIFIAGGEFIRMNGSDTLSRNLTSQAVFFPAGTSVEADVQLDWYRLGYQYEFALDLEGEQQLLLAPGIQGVILDFDYQLDGGGALQVDRSYAKGGVRIGGTVEWLTGGPFSLEAGAWWGMPISNTAEILSVELIGRYRFWDDRAAAYLGVAFESIEYEDDQSVPNHIDVDLGPLLVAGFEIRF